VNCCASPTSGTDGLKSKAFTSADEALPVREDDAGFDIAISDYLMPGMDGISFLGRLHDVRPETLRILITASADVHGAVKAINEARIDFLILKPWSEYDLQGRIALALHQRRLQRSRAAPAIMILSARAYRLMLVDDEDAVLKALSGRSRWAAWRLPAGGRCSASAATPRRRMR
jgi:response regulator RpfG family c-di-GMP phosphodiesterase